MQTATATPPNPPVTTTGCCPRFDPEPFQDKEVVWQDELFVKEHVRSLFHLPLNIRGRMMSAHALIEAAGAQASVPLTLSDETSAWGSDLYIRVSKQVPGATMATLPGKYLTRVFEGPFRDAPKWAEQMTQFVAERGQQLEKIFFAYTTCPACAKAYGANYVVLFAKLRE
jgi:hypothetical protein